MWLHGFEDEPEDEDGAGDIDLRITLVLAWDLTFCMVSFRTPEVKERWLDTLHRKIKEAKDGAGCTSPPPSVLMKVLSGNITTKTLTGGGMEQFIEFPLDGDAKISALSKPLCNQEDRPTHAIENSKWNILRKLRKGSLHANLSPRSETDTKTQLFGRPLCKICPDHCSLPKPVTDMLVLLWKKGPSTEGVFRKPGNSKTMKTIRDQLNSGLEVDMEGLPVLLLVGLLKSFLKELPGSLLVSEMYDTWMKALDTDETQRVSEIKSVVDSLPGLNRLLLQHLLSVLHHILQSADTNKMDAYNLAVCIAPTLLQLDCTALDEQKVKLDKVTELTQFLIENCEMLGENLLNLLVDTDEDTSDSLSSQQHDSAYDSPDPDAEADPGERSSSPSLLYACTAVPSCPSDAIFHAFTKPAPNRRCSEPIIFPSAEIRSLRSLARSHDDCSLEKKDFEEQPLKKQISDDSFLLGRRAGARPALAFPKLPSKNPSKNWSCSSSCSLESTASNQSEGSVFTSSPLVSPTCPRRANSIHLASFGVKPRKDINRTDSEGTKRSQSVRGEYKGLVKNKSLGSFSFTRGSLKKGDPQKENPFPCGTVQEDSQSEAEPPAELPLKPRPRPFQHLSCRPPSYEQAVQNAGLPALPQYRSMTVQHARELGKKSRPTSMSDDFLPTCPVNQYTDCFAQAAGDEVSSVERPPLFRQRAMSESVSRAHHNAVSRRCSQPVFEEYSYAKESYV
ncbi:T cell activation RhoGTPase activating protein b [Polymixia lowei]